MSLQHPVRRWALRPANLFSISSTTTRLITRRPFSLFQEAQRQTSLRTIQSQPQFQSQLHQALRTRRGFHNSRPRFNRSSYTYQAPNGSPSLSQRLKTLSKEYGWSALWIYLFLSALDFPFCFAAVKLLGADKIGHYEQVVVEGFKRGVNKIWSGAFEESKDEDREEAAAEKKKGSAEEASLWTQLALAYAIHKSFIFFRVPLTAAVTPKVVKQLRKWGWDVVKGKPKAK